MKNNNSTKKPSVQKTYHIRSKFRLCIFITLLLIIFISLTSSIWIKGNALGTISMVNIEIKEGDTLWSIARQSLPRGRDIRDFIIEIKTVNSLDDANLLIGQQLIIPVYGTYQIENSIANESIELGMND